jgi:hypothetical protein
VLLLEYGMQAKMEVGFIEPASLAMKQPHYAVTVVRYTIAFTDWNIRLGPIYYPFQIHAIKAVLPTLTFKTK